jgi:hypothetical protein
VVFSLVSPSPCLPLFPILPRSGLIPPPWACSPPMMGYSMGSSMTMRSTPILFALLAGTVFVSCSREEPVAPRVRKDQDRNTSQTTSKRSSLAAPDQDGRRWAILSEADLAKADGGNHFRGVWQPSESEVPRIIQEARLYLGALKKTASSDDERKRIGEALAGWDHYLCQAVGHTKEGKRLIHLNFFLDVFPREVLSEAEIGWHHHYSEMFGDGAACWRTEYDYEANEFLDFYVNSGFRRPKKP